MTAKTALTGVMWWNVAGSIASTSARVIEGRETTGGGVTVIGIEDCRLPVLLLGLVGVADWTVERHRCRLEKLARRTNMPGDSHRRAAEFHELAAHAHRAAAVSHDKEDHLTGHEHSKLAMEHAKKAFEWSQAAHGKSGKSAGKT
jgi:hypothetical protein